MHLSSEVLLRFCVFLWVSDLLWQLLECRVMDLAMQWWAFHAPASLCLAMFWIFLCAWTSVFFCAILPFLCSPGSAYQHVQRDYICLAKKRAVSLFTYSTRAMNCCRLGLLAWPLTLLPARDLSISGLACLENSLGDGATGKWKQSVMRHAPALIMFVHRKRLFKDFWARLWSKPNKSDKC